MRIAISLLLSLVCTAAAAQTASRESVDRLMSLTSAQRVLALVQAQQSSMMNSMVERQVQQKQLTIEQAQRARAATRKALEAVNRELSWDKLEPIMAQVYMETFTEDEVQGLIAFYESPTGRAFVEKMPQATQRTLQLIQARVGPALERAQASVREELANPAPAATPPPPPPPQ